MTHLILKVHASKIVTDNGNFQIRGKSLMNALMHGLFTQTSSTGNRRELLYLIVALRAR